MERIGSMRRIRMMGLMGVLAAGLAIAAPAAAQQFSEGFEFLKAVKDRDGTKVTAALDRPGSTVINARDLSTGQGALHVVVARRDATWLRFLIAKGANPDLADKAGVTAMQLAASLSWNEGVQILAKAGASVDIANSTGETPLISAIHQRDMEMVRALLAAGANPERSDNSGRNARDYAKLLGPQSAILAELDRAREERKARAAKSYGPG
jgi:ankyrin repeat protein